MKISLIKENVAEYQHVYDGRVAVLTFSKAHVSQSTPVSSYSFLRGGNGERVFCKTPSDDR